MSSADASSSAADARGNTTTPSSSSPPLPPVPTDPATTAKEWYKWYAAWISRFWPRIREEAKGFGLIPADYRSAVKPEMISSTDVSDAAVALCHYLVSAYEQVYAHYDLNAVHMQQYAVANWAYPELGYLDKSVKEAGGKSIVVLRMWLKDRGNLRTKREVHYENRVNDTMWKSKPFLPKIPDYWWALQGEQPPPPEEENAGSADGGGGGETQQQKDGEGEDNQDMEMENAEN